ncbi:MAG: peptide chain release factor 1 [Planctomycetota bacterium]
MEFVPSIVAKLREKAERHRELARLLEDPAVACDPHRFPDLLREQGQLAGAVGLAREMEALFVRRREAEEVLATGGDGDLELVEMAREELGGLEDEERALDRRIKSELISDADLKRDKIIVEIRAGIGGDEATLFCRDLSRMYQRFCEDQGWKTELMSAKPSEVGGFKELVLGVRGDGAWRLFRFESGGHRVQRVPETESQGRIHTSAATVAVLPEAEEVDIEIKSEDLRIDTMRAGGAGGQHVNKTESAVRIVHIPTDTTVVCMDEKSQHKNKARAMRILRAKLFELERSRLHAERAADRKSQVGSGDRSERIRTYNFPQNRCSDHRLGQNFSLEQVLAGRLGPLLEALEERDRTKRIERL